MNRSNVILIATGAVVVVASGVLAFLAQGKFSASAKADKRVKSDLKKLEEVYKSELFPSAENVETLKAQAESLSKMRAAITNDLAKYNTPAPQRTPSVFLQVLPALTRSLVEQAPVVDGKKSVASGFAFGFDRYLGPTAAMPEAGDVPRLLQQLYIVDELVKTLYASQVSQISSVSREIFESGAPAGSDQEEGGGGKGRRRGGRANVSHGHSTDAAQKTFNGLFSYQHFKVDFTAHQAAAIDFLNRVASLEKFFCVVTDVSFRKTAPDVILPAEKSGENAIPQPREPSRKSRRGRSGEDDAESKEAAPAEEGLAVQKTSSLPAELRVMSGPEVDPVLACSVEIDVYYFGQNPALAAPADKEEE